MNIEANKVWGTGKNGFGKHLYLIYVPLSSVLVRWDSIVGIATGYGLDDRGVGVRDPEGSRIFSALRRSDPLWGPPKLLCNGYRGLFPQG
jgi:hypothetical protein